MKVSGYFFRKLVLKALFPVCVISIIFYGGCDKEEPLPRAHPKIRTLEVADISTEGARFSGRIERQGSEEIIEWGFVWDTNQNPKIETAEYYSERYSTGQETIHRDVLSTLVAGDTYYVKLFARTSSFVIYGNEVVFESLGSMGHISYDFNPKKGLIASQVKISGEGFSKRIFGGNIVKFDSLMATVIETSDTLITVLVPDGLHNANSVISVQVANKTDVLPGAFQLSGPEITTFSPIEGTIGDTVTIEGKNISIPDVAAKVKFNTFNADVIEKSMDKLVVIVPPMSGLDKYILTVETGALKATAKEKFTILRPTISSVSPMLAMVGDTLNIQGSNFSWMKAQNIVKLDNQNCDVVHATRDNLSVVVPPPRDNLIGSFRNPSALTVSIATIMSYGNTSFTYRAPNLEEMPIVSATFHDTLSFTGTNLSYFQGEWKISINNILLPVVSLSDQALKVVIPAKNLGNGVIDIATKHYNTQIFNSFRAPQITSISPSTVTFGDEVKINCNYLNPDLSVNVVYLNDQPVAIHFGSNNELLIRVPENIITNNGNIKVTVSTSDGEAFQASMDNSLVLEKPEITSISPLILSMESNRLTINGKGFNPDESQVDVNFWGTRFRVISADRNQIIAEFPFENYPFSNTYNGWQGSVELYCAGFVLQTQQDVRIDFPSPWKWKSNFPLNGVLDGTAFSIGNKGYIVAGQSPLGHADHKNVWEYDPVSDGWIQKADFPGEARSGAFGVSDNTVAYVGFGWAHGQYYKKDIWRYEVNDDRWTEIPEFPGVERIGAMAFLHGGLLYVGFGYNDSNKKLRDFWVFNLSTNQWTRLPDIPYLMDHRNSQAKGCSIINDIGYCNISSWAPSGGDFSRYTCILTFNFSNGTWQQIPNQQIFSPTNYPTCQVGSDWIFINNGVNIFNPNKSPNWSYISPWPGSDPNSGMSFAINGKFYGGLGYYNQIWEFDPSKVK